MPIVNTFPLFAFILSTCDGGLGCWVLLCEVWSLMSDGVSCCRVHTHTHKHWEKGKEDKRWTAAYRSNLRCGMVLSHPELATLCFLKNPIEMSKAKHQEEELTVYCICTSVHSKMDIYCRERKHRWTVFFGFFFADFLDVQNLAASPLLPSLSISTIWVKWNRNEFNMWAH